MTSLTGAVPRTAPSRSSAHTTGFGILASPSSLLPRGSSPDTFGYRRTIVLANPTHGHSHACFRVLVVGALWLLLGATGASAAPGDLDTNFSGDGLQSTDFGGTDAAGGLAVLPGGQLLAVGAKVTYHSELEQALARYRADGSPDTTFSGDGRHTLEFGEFTGATDFALQSDGKIILAGLGGPIGNKLWVARLNTDGSVDTTFGVGGTQTTTFPDYGYYTQPAGLVIDHFDRIVVAGNAYRDDQGSSRAGHDFAMARFTPAGSLDPTFGVAGRVTTDMGRGQARALAIAMAPDGKLVIAGVANGPYYYDYDPSFLDLRDFALARYLPDGQLDPMFDSDGRVTTNFGGMDDSAAAVAIQSDGKVVAVGNVGYLVASSPASDLTIARYNLDGSLDSSFAGDGRQTTSFPGGAWAAALAMEPNGRIIVVGNYDYDVILVRYNSNGTLSSSFGGGGVQLTGLGESDATIARAAAAAIQPDGKIVVAGGICGGDCQDFLVARYEGGGESDASDPSGSPQVLQPAPGSVGGPPVMGPDASPAPSAEPFVDGVLLDPGLPCPKVELVGVRGSGQGINEYRGYGRAVDTFRRSLHAATRKKLTSAQFVDYALPYSAVAVDWDVLAPGLSYSRGVATKYRRSVDDGVDKLATHLEDGHARCPKTRFILAGYSQGAHVVGDLLAKREGVPKGVRKRIVGVVFFGDPKFNGNEKMFVLRGSFDASFSGIRGPRATGKLKGASKDFTVYSYCRDLDSVCQRLQGPLLNAFVSTKAHERYHEAYAQAAAKAVAKFMIKRLE